MGVFAELLVCILYLYGVKHFVLLAFFFGPSLLMC